MITSNICLNCSDNCSNIVVVQVFLLFIVLLEWLQFLLFSSHVLQNDILELFLIETIVVSLVLHGLLNLLRQFHVSMLSHNLLSCLVNLFRLYSPVLCSLKHDILECIASHSFHDCFDEEFKLQVLFSDDSIKENLFSLFLDSRISSRYLVSQSFLRF